MHHVRPEAYKGRQDAPIQFERAPEQPLEAICLQHSTAQHDDWKPGSTRVCACVRMGMSYPGHSVHDNLLGDCQRDQVQECDHATTEEKQSESTHHRHTIARNWLPRVLVVASGVTVLQVSSAQLQPLHDCREYLQGPRILSVQELSRKRGSMQTGPGETGRFCCCVFLSDFCVDNRAAVL
jgi:hypothetical protein